VSKKKAKRTALRRRNRAERTDDYRGEILQALNRAGSPLQADELAASLAIRPRERRVGAVQRLQNLAAIVVASFRPIPSPQRCSFGFFL
jgi:hypothetical protein